MSKDDQVDEYAYWRTGLQITGGKRSLSKDEMNGLKLTSEPQLGFFRRRMRSQGPFVPVAIWRDGNGNLVAVADGRPADPEDVWTHCCPHPVLHQAYTAKVEGGQWPDEDGAVTDSTNGAPGPDHNQGPQDEAEILKGKIEAASANIGEYDEITSDETAGKAQSLRARLNELSNQADKKRETEKAPHLAAGKAVDAKWQPVVKLGKDLADKLRRALSAYETHKAKVEAEARAKAAAAAPPSPQGAPPSPPPPEAAAPRTRVKGAYGKAAAVKVIYTAAVKDQDAAYAFFRGEDELAALIQKLAQRAVDAGVKEIPGVEIEEGRDVR